MAPILKAVQSRCSLPIRGSEEHHLILLYTLVQHTRTAHSIDAHNEQTDKLMKYLMAPEMDKMNLSPKEIAGIKITHKEPAQFLLNIAIPQYSLLQDLEWKLLRAAGTHEFITSDNPIVYYNQFFTFRRFGSNTGIASKGLQIFFPISPKLLLVFYDAGVYGVGSKKCDVVDVFDAHDMEQLNRLQFVSALENVYFYGGSYPAFEEFHSSQRYRRPQKSRMQIFPSEETATHRKELIMMSKDDVRTELNLSFLRVLKPAKEWRRAFQATTPQPAVVVRNRRLMQEHESFMKRAAV